MTNRPRLLDLFCGAGGAGWMQPAGRRPSRQQAAESQSASLYEALEDERAARRIASESADRFRDVISEVLELDQNPGDDALVDLLRALNGKTGPEPRRWRDFITGAEAFIEHEGLRWATDVALDDIERST